MQDVVVVTTFAKDHIDLYGNKFVDCFKRYCNYKLEIFAEDFTAEDLSSPIEVNDFYSFIPEQKDFRNHIESELLRLRKKPANRLLKALRWSYKSFVIWHALQNIDAKYIVWMDSDVECISPVPYNLIEKINGDRLMTVYPQIIDGELHIESGLVIFNKQHKYINHVIKHYYAGYHEKQVLDIQKPWDGFWLGKLINESTRIQKSSLLIKRPFINVEPYFYHNVGKEKFRDTELNKFSGRK
jgi:hypothetical protein